jgi:hypothetical protein
MYKLLSDFLDLLMICHRELCSKKSPYLVLFHHFNSCIDSLCGVSFDSFVDPGGVEIPVNWTSLQECS